jgi:hypothetical protein
MSTGVHYVSELTLATQRTIGTYITGENKESSETKVLFQITSQG